MSPTLAPPRAARPLSGPQMRASVDAGSRWAWQLEEPLAAIYAAEILNAYRTAARRLAAHAGAITSAEHAHWTIPDPDELGLALRQQMDDAYLTGITGVPQRDAAPDADANAIRVEAVRRVTDAGLTTMNVSLTTRNRLVEGVLRDQLGGNIGIAHTTRQAIMSSLETSWQRGYSIPRAAARLRAEAPEVSASRSRTIARTELIGAVNGGAHALAELSNGYAERDGVAPLRKIWLTAEDEKVRPDHVDAGRTYAAGSGIPMEKPFVVGDAALMYPGDPAGPAGEVINCRCAISYEQPGEPEAHPADVDAEPSDASEQGDPAALFTAAQDRVLADEGTGDAAQYAAWRAYSHGSYLDMNAVARGTAPADWPAERVAEAEARNAALGALLDREGLTLDRPTVLYRGVDSEIATGQTIDDPAFLSTSVSTTEPERLARRAADGVVLRIAVPAGTRYLPGSQLGEGEIILPRGSRLRVGAEASNPGESFRVFDAELQTAAGQALRDRLAAERAAQRAAETPAEMQERMDRDARNAETMRRLEEAERAERERQATRDRNDLARRRMMTTLNAEPLTSQGNEVLLDQVSEAWGVDQTRRMFASRVLADNDLVVRASSSDFVDQDGAGVHINALISTRDGAKVAELERDVYPDSHKAYNAAFFTSKAWQGKGIAKDLLRSAVAEYDAAGITEIGVHAAGTNGRYTWARFGFDYNQPSYLKHAKSDLKAKLWEQAADRKIGAPDELKPTNANLKALFPKTVARIDAAEHAWEVAAMSVDPSETSKVRQFYGADPSPLLRPGGLGREAMLAGGDWRGTLDLTPGSATRKVFDDYTR